MKLYWEKLLMMKVLINRVLHPYFVKGTRGVQHGDWTCLHSFLLLQKLLILQY